MWLSEKDPNILSVQLVSSRSTQDTILSIDVRGGKTPWVDGHQAQQSDVEIIASRQQWLERAIAAMVGPPVAPQKPVAAAAAVAPQKTTEAIIQERLSVRFPQLPIQQVVSVDKGYQIIYKPGFMFPAGLIIPWLKGYIYDRRTSFITTNVATALEQEYVAAMAASQKPIAAAAVAAVAAVAPQMSAETQIMQAYSRQYGLPIQQVTRVKNGYKIEYPIGFVFPKGQKIDGLLPFTGDPRASFLSDQDAVPIFNAQGARGKGVVPFDVSKTVIKQLVYRDPGSTESDKQQALQWDGVFYDPSMRAPFVKSNGMPMHSLTIRIPVDRPTLVGPMQHILGRPPQQTGDAQYPTTWELSIREVEKLLTSFSLSIDDIDRAAPINLTIKDVASPGSALSADLVPGVAIKPPTFEFSSDDTIRPPDQILSQFVRLFPKETDRQELIDQFNQTWRMAEKEIGGKRVMMFLSLVSDFLQSVNPPLKPDENQLLTGIKEGLGKTCYAAKLNGLELTCGPWLSMKRGTVAQTMSVNQIVFINFIQEFKEAIVNELADIKGADGRPHENATHLASYLSQRWATLFGCPSATERAARYGVGFVAAQ